MDRADIIGKQIKYLRNQAQITQSQLAEGIGTQAQISKIESGEVIPLCTTLYEIAYKLGVDVNYFYNQAYHPRFDYVNEIKYQIRKSIRERNYEEVEQLIRAEEAHLAFKMPINHQFMLWHKGVVEYYIRKDVNKSLNLLETAFMIGKGKNSNLPISIQDIEILNSQAIIYNEISDFNHSVEIYKNALNYLKNMPEIPDKRVVIRLYYGIAKSLFKLELFKESISYCNKGINLCLNEELLYLLGELHYEAGQNYQALNNNIKASDHYSRAKETFYISNRKEFLEATESKLIQIQKSGR
ncbi:helix-turn-helix domain-containing protein [Mesobacillus jeotgali]|uniref:helix-turn-helix domain-containing protein n=1 Tax=Mesobacillus jeotgali TaxID=129985 RepID=UPI000C847A1A|nr:helix-turn-helix domain-containing protein [Mesobacillus jeotgali]